MLCPYCGSSDHSESSAGDARRSTHQLRLCSGCSGYSVIANGKIYPVHDRTDPNGDALTRVVDG